ncbi:MAG: hypothetical protein JWM05_2694 [Acidimicrobiales bacterium]|nr:hypothetical protein [Acidimicrobiales bacterium]
MWGGGAVRRSVAPMSRYRFALRPKWILSHLFVLVLVVAMINLGFWQLRRLQEKKDRNRRYRERTAQPVVPLSALVTTRSPAADVEADQFRRVTLRGTYRPDQEVLVRSRSQNGAPGSWVLTPLVLPDGTGVIVNRGWINNSGQLDAVPATVRAPTGTVTVIGLVQPTETRGRFGPIDPPTGRLTNLARADVARIQRQVPERLVPAWVQLQTQAPQTARAVNRPRPLDPPALDEGPHLSYAVQWFIFTTVAVVGYPLILRRRAGEIEIEEADDALDAPDPDDLPFDDDPRLAPVSDGPTPPAP